MTLQGPWLHETVEIEPESVTVGTMLTSKGCLNHNCRSWSVKLLSCQIIVAEGRSFPPLLLDKCGGGETWSSGHNRQVTVWSNRMSKECVCLKSAYV
jgi:hypothetical protein